MFPLTHRVASFDTLLARHIFHLDLKIVVFPPKIKVFTHYIFIAKYVHVHIRPQKNAEEMMLHTTDGDITTKLAAHDRWKKLRSGRRRIGNRSKKKQANCMWRLLRRIAGVSDDQ